MNFPGVPDYLLSNFILSNNLCMDQAQDIVKEENYNSVLNRNSKISTLEPEINEVPENILEARRTSDSKQ